MKNKDYFLQKLDTFLSYLLSGTTLPGMVVWGTKCDAELTNNKEGEGYFFDITQDDLPEIYNEFEIRTDMDAESWRDHFENGANRNKVDITSKSLYLRLVVYKKGLF